MMYFTYIWAIRLYSVFCSGTVIQASHFKAALILKGKFPPVILMIKSRRTALNTTTQIDAASTHSFNFLMTVLAKLLLKMSQSLNDETSTQVITYCLVIS